jgi:hypothetical protein
MSFILIIAGLFLMNFVLVRNCTIFVSIKAYPAVCNYSLFKKMGGVFSFTREVPQLLKNSPRTFERKSIEVEDGGDGEGVRRSSSSRKSRKEQLAEVHELQSLRKFENGVRRNGDVHEVVVER